MLFALHHILNLGWLKARFRGKYPPVRVLGLIVNDLLLAAMLCMTASGIIMSRYVFALPSNFWRDVTRSRVASVYWGFILMAAHLGLHWSMILGMLRKTGARKAFSRVPVPVWRLAGLGVAVYGLTALIRRDLLSYMFLRTQFVFFDFSEPVPLFYLDYLAIMGLFVFAAHYGSLLLRKAVARREKKAAAETDSSARPGNAASPESTASQEGSASAAEESTEPAAETESAEGAEETTDSCGAVFRSGFGVRGR